MKRLLASLLVILGLAAAGLHAPAMALPELAPSAAALHADCHGDPAPVPAGQTAPADLSCCPDGCDGGCLLPGAMMQSRGVEERIAARMSPAVPAVEEPRQGVASGMFHPPRTFA